MRKIVAGLFISLDGVYEAPNLWHFPYFNDEMGQEVGAQMADSDTMLLGRQTFQEFASYWPQQSSDVPPADFMNKTPKVVVSSTLKAVDEWQHSTLISGNVAEELRKLKEQPGKNIGITGSGKRLFDDTTSGKVPLKLVESKTFSTGVLALTYVPAEQ